MNCLQSLRVYTFYIIASDADEILLNVHKRVNTNTVKTFLNRCYNEGDKLINLKKLKSNYKINGFSANDS